MFSSRRNVLSVCALLAVCAVLGWRLAERRRQSVASLERLSALVSEATNAPAPAPAPKPNPHWVATTTLPKGVRPRYADATFTNRLRNTAASAGDLVRNEHAILLRNAFVDTANGEPLAIPAQLRTEGDAGAYVVQAVGGITPKFREELIAAGARIVSYIPNNALLVTADAAAAERLARLPDARPLAYEPYFKLEPQLLPLALGDAAPADSLKLILTVTEPDAVLPQISALGAHETFRERGPFGTLITVETPGGTLAALARLSGVQLIERWQPVRLANDLTGYALGSTTNADNTGPYLGLTGKGVQINLNDSGVEATHPDLGTNRVFAVDSAFLQDVDGHGTHVAGILAGSGAQSASLAVPPQGSVSNANYQGRAPGAELYVLPVDLIQGPASGDTYLQETAAANPRRKNSRNQPLISNNSWGYQSFDYSTHSASYDAAVRDALPAVSGDQPILYVFSAGNSGNGGDNGQGGDFDSVSSPGNAKNVITVGALESPRNLTNAVVTLFTNSDPNQTVVVVAAGSTVLRPDLWPPDTTNTTITYQTNYPYGDMTDSDYQVAGFSSRGNVGIGTEGDVGRFKPDVVAPGTFIISTRSSKWQLTNDYPLPFYEVDYDLLSDLEAETAPYYRYETGTSMAAPAVAGLLAQMQEYFQQPTNNLRVPSAAGFKALLLNGAQPTSPTYYPDPHNSANYGGWGEPNLARVLQSQLTRGGQPLYVIESDDVAGQPVGLATGEARSFSLSGVTNAAALRLTLVWTDPPGNPAGASKLVNDLDLVVSNVITHEVIFGNDFDPGTGLSRVQSTNDLSRFDRLNNVERIVFNPDTSTNGSYVISVVAHRVNVNARADAPAAVVQDFSLAIGADLPADSTAAAAGDVAAITAGLTPPGAGRPPVTGITNGGAYFSERVGANSPLINGTIGQTNQWQFYTFTNSPYTNLSVFSITNDAGGNPVTNYLKNGSNVAFVTFPYNAQGNLARGRTNEADIDLYVSRDPALLNLDPTVLGQAFKSTSRGGTELVYFTNSPVKGEVYYVGVKSEDQQAAEYGFVGLSTDQPFNTLDANGVAHVLTVPLRQPIPDGTPNRPGLGLYLAISILPGEIRGVTPKVTTGYASTNTSDNFPDLLGNLTHNGNFAVLNNHGQLLNKNSGVVTVTYDDTQSGRYPGSVHSDGPGSLLNFMGRTATGPWFLATSDNTLGNVSRINYLDLGLLPNDFGSAFVHRCADAGFFQLEVINVPADASSLTVTVTNMSPALPLQVYIRREAFPDLVELTNNDKTATLFPPGGDVTLGVRDIPPLQAGRYFIAVYNPNPVQVCYLIRGRIEHNLDGSLTRTFTSTDRQLLPDMARTLSRIKVTDTRPVTAVEVGLRIDHPRESDLAIRLVGPSGGEGLVMENRGQADGQGLGSLLITTNKNFAHVALTYDRPSGLAVLYVNGVQVAGEVVPGYVPATTNGLYFGYDPTGTFASASVPQLDDFGVWGRALQPSEVQKLFRNGLSGIGKTVLDADHGLLALWPFDKDGTDLILTNRVFLNPGSHPVTGQINFAVQGAGNVAPSAALDVGSGNGFTLEGWVSAGTQTNVVLAGWGGTTNGVFGPALLANFSGTNGNGIGSISAQLAAGGGLTLLSPTNVALTNAITTNILYAVFSDLTNGVSQMIKFATPPFVSDTRTGVVAQADFETNPPSYYSKGAIVDGWTVVNGIVQEVYDPESSLTGNSFISLFPAQAQSGEIQRTFVVVPGRSYTASFGYRRAFGASSGNYGLDVLNGSQALDSVVASDSWQTYAYSFQATNSQFVLAIRNSANAAAGTWLDQFLLVDDGSGFYLPEEPLLPATGAGAGGDWLLDITDTRTNFAGTLLGWQLALTFAPTNPPAVTLTNGVSYSSSVAGSDIKYFIVEVPPEATGVTNTLVSVTGGPLNLLFDQTGIPDGLQPEDYTLLSGVTSASQSYVLSTNMPPKLKPGQRYYLGVQNAAAGQDNQFVIQVDFALNVIPLTNHVAYRGTNANAGLIDYYSYDVSSNAFAVSFGLTNLGGDVNLVASRAPLIPTRTAYDFASTNSGLLPETIQILPNDPTTLLAPGRWYLGVYVADPATPLLPIAYTIVVNETPAPRALTNRVVLTDTLTNVTAITYYYFDLTNDVTVLSFAATNLSGNVNLFLREGLPPPKPLDFDYASTNGGKTNELIQVTPAYPGVPLTHGRWFLAVAAVDPEPVSYSLLVSAGAGGGSGEIIDLTDSVPVSQTHAVGAAADDYSFVAPPGTTGLLFEIYDLSGEADLYAAAGLLPSQAAPSAVISNPQPGTTPELIVLRVDATTTDLGGTYYLEVRFPGTVTNSVNYTIRAATDQGGLLESGQLLLAVFLPSTQPGGPLVAQFNSVPGESYEFQYTDDLFAPVVQWTALPPPVTATGSVTTLTTPAPASTGASPRFFRILQVPSP